MLREAASRTEESVLAVLLPSPDEFGFWRRAYCLVFKRWFDFSAAALLLVVLSPLLLISALAVRISSGGPVIFRQTRIGKDGMPFVMYKFATMIRDRRVRRLSYIGPERRVRHKTEDDPRVTGLGRLLRRTSIDELPQLVNVLRGEMSLVGPRPELPEIVRNYQSWQHQRHRVRPGMTGWWQVQGRKIQPMYEHTDLDIYYVVNQSAWLDVKILWGTFPLVIWRYGAF